MAGGRGGGGGHGGFYEYIEMEGDLGGLSMGGHDLNLNPCPPKSSHLDITWTPPLNP